MSQICLNSRVINYDFQLDWVLIKRKYCRAIETSVELGALIEKKHRKVLYLLKKLSIYRKTDLNIFDKLKYLHSLKKINLDFNPLTNLLSTRSYLQLKELTELTLNITEILEKTHIHKFLLQLRKHGSIKSLSLIDANIEDVYQTFYVMDILQKYRRLRLLSLPEELFSSQNKTIQGINLKIQDLNTIKKFQSQLHILRIAVLFPSLYPVIKALRELDIQNLQILEIEDKTRNTDLEGLSALLSFLSLKRFTFKRQKLILHEDFSFEAIKNFFNAINSQKNLKLLNLSFNFFYSPELNVYLTSAFNSLERLEEFVLDYEFPETHKVLHLIRPLLSLKNLCIRIPVEKGFGVDTRLYFKQYISNLQYLQCFHCQFNLLRDQKVSLVDLFEIMEPLTHLSNLIELAIESPKTMTNQDIIFTVEFLKLYMNLIKRCHRLRYLQLISRKLSLSSTEMNNFLEIFLEIGKAYALRIVVQNIEFSDLQLAKEMFNNLGKFSQRNLGLIIKQLARSDNFLSRHMNSKANLSGEPISLFTFDDI